MLPQTFAHSPTFLKQITVSRLLQDGANALKLAKELKEIYILLDVMMPIMDGYAVCKALKENSLTHKIPVILSQLKDSPEDEAYGFSLGTADYITKPFNPATAKVRNQASN